MSENQMVALGTLMIQYIQIDINYFNTFSWRKIDYLTKLKDSDWVYGNKYRKTGLLNPHVGGSCFSLPSTDSGTNERCDISNN